MTAEKKVAAVSPTDTDQDYYALERLVADRAATATGPLFETAADGLFECYLTALPAERRQHYDCRACRRFVERYGGLATLDAGGRQEPLLWDEAAAPPFFAQAVAVLAARVRKAKVTGVFLTDAAGWGVPRTGDWTHLHAVRPPNHRGVLTAAQAAAAKREEYVMLKRSLDEFGHDAAAQAVRVLEAGGALDRAEKTLGAARWLLALHEALRGARGRERDNLVWAAVAAAPPGWCHVRSSMIGTLLEDVVAGLPYEAIRERWAAKMHPLRYQRPTALKDGAVEQAERLFEQTGAGPALKRRFARLSEVTACWLPTAASTDAGKGESGAGRLFDHLRPGASVKEVELPPVKVTWEKFRTQTLPQALALDWWAPHGTAQFYGLVTAADPEAKPLLQWDGLAGRPRNPVSWYFYHGGSTAVQWGLEAGAWVRVNAVLDKPCHWQEPERFPHRAPAAFLVLDGARDLRYTGGGLFFPEQLRAEYHGVRQVLERHARTGTVEGRDEGDANGVAFPKGMTDADFRLRVRTPGGWVKFIVDRWE